MDQAAPASNLSPIRVAPDTLATPSGMIRTKFCAMGTTVTLLFPETHGARASALVRHVFQAWEQTLSRFLPESELSRLNGLAGEPVIVSQLLFTVLEAALAAARATGGLYDPTLLHQLVQAGYDRSFDRLLAQQPAAPSSTLPPLPGGSWRQIRLDPLLHRVTLPPGIGLDFGGIAKGMAVDAALARLRDLPGETALVNAGGDLAVMGLPAGYASWPLSIEGKVNNWTIPLQHGALATSSRAKRHWRQGSHPRHHLLDPRTGEPAQSQLWSVTVAAEQCMQAEVAAKAAFVLGAEQGRTFLNEHGLAGLLVEKDGSWTTAGNWPTELMQLL